MCLLNHKIMSSFLAKVGIACCYSLHTAIFDHLLTGFAEGDSGQKDQFDTENENVAKETLEEPDKPSKAYSEVKKTWGFRRSTVAKREMPVEAATDSPENRCPVRRSGRQSKRTDKLEEFLLTAKRGSRKSAPPSLESGDPPSQTPTDAETASEASFDGNADTKAVEDKVESPERRTRSVARKPTQRRTRGGRQARGGGRVTVKDEGSSENEEDARDVSDKDQLLEKKDENSYPNTEDVESTNTVQPQPEPNSETKTGAVEEKNEHDKVEMKKETDEETEEDGTDKPAAISVKRGPIRTYINKKRAATKNTPAVKTPASVKRETLARTTQASGKTPQPQEDNDGEDEEEDEDDSSTSSSSSSSESEDGGYDPNALYCICRQKHNKRYIVLFLSIIAFILITVPAMTVECVNTEVHCTVQRTYHI